MRLLAAVRIHRLALGRPTSPLHVSVAPRFHLIVAAALAQIQASNAMTLTTSHQAAVLEPKMMAPVAAEFQHSRRTELQLIAQLWTVVLSTCQFAPQDAPQRSIHAIWMLPRMAPPSAHTAARTSLRQSAGSFHRALARKPRTATATVAWSARPSWPSRSLHHKQTAQQVTAVCTTLAAPVHLAALRLQ